jgi:hypothetical protein
VGHHIGVGQPGSLADIPRPANVQTSFRTPLTARLLFDMEQLEQPREDQTDYSIFRSPLTARLLFDMKQLEQPREDRTDYSIFLVS